MRQDIFEDECDIPTEFEGAQSVGKNSVQSPKPKESKLCLDKGYVKKDDDLFFNFSFINNQCTQRQCCASFKFMKKTSQLDCHPGTSRHCESPNQCYLKDPDFLRKLSDLEESKLTGCKDSSQRKRFQSLHSNKFELAPLLRKVSCDQVPSENSTPVKHNELIKEEPYSLGISAEQDDDSVSNGEDSCKGMVTMGDISPA